MHRDDLIEFIRKGRITELSGYRLKRPDWRPDLSGASLLGCDLSKADLRVAAMKGADLSGARLFGADLRGADLRDAVLDGTDVMCASFHSSNLCGADFSFEPGVLKGLFDDPDLQDDARIPDLTEARYDSNTQFHEWFDPTACGMVLTTQSDSAPPITAFISYAWVNKEPVLAIDTWLRRHGIQTRLDRRDFFAGSRLRDEITRVMVECEVILVFRSQKSADKPWPQFEQELAADMEMAAKQEGRSPPRVIYVVIDDVELPNISEKGKLAIMARGKRFEAVCEEIYRTIAQIPADPDDVDLSKWKDFRF